MNPHIYDQLMLNKSTNIPEWGKDSLIVNGYGKWTSTCAGMKLDRCLTPHTRVKSKWTKVLRVRPKTIKLLGKNRQ